MKAFADRYLVTDPTQRAFAFVLRTAKQELVHGQWFIDEDSRLALQVLHAAGQEQD